VSSAAPQLLLKAVLPRRAASACSFSPVTRPGPFVAPAAAAAANWPRPRAPSSSSALASAAATAAAAAASANGLRRPPGLREFGPAACGPAPAPGSSEDASRGQLKPHSLLLSRAKAPTEREGAGLGLPESWPRGASESSDESAAPAPPHAPPGPRGAPLPQPRAPPSALPPAEMRHSPPALKGLPAAPPPKGPNAAAVAPAPLGPFAPPQPLSPPSAHGGAAPSLVAGAQGLLRSAGGADARVRPSAGHAARTGPGGRPCGPPIGAVVHSLDWGHGAPASAACCSAGAGPSQGRSSRGRFSRVALLAFWATAHGGHGGLAARRPAFRQRRGGSQDALHMSTEAHAGKAWALEGLRRRQARAQKTALS
jgi:hypothetical protein